MPAFFPLLVRQRTVREELRLPLGGLLAFLLTFSASAVAQNPDLQTARAHAAALGAHHLCSGLWVVGRDYPRDADRVLAEDIAPFPAFAWQDDFRYDVNVERRTVTVRGSDVGPKTAKYNGDQGCSILPDGAHDVYFEPVPAASTLPDASEQAWPMGDRESTGTLPASANAGRFEAALDWAMAQQEQNTRAFVVIHDGKIVGERYAPGWTKDTPQISWSQGKSITAALVGVLIQQGELALDEPAPVAAWRQPGDPRGGITVADLLHMSSGLGFANNGLSGLESYNADNEHMRIYFDALNVFDHAVNQPQEIPPNAQFRYRSSDPLTLGRIVRETVEARGEEYLTFPRRALFDKIGARNYALETDPYGNFIMTGYDYGSGRDWARFGLLHLWDGEWNGERILPKGWSEVVSTPAPGDPTLGYGGLFWLNRGGRYDRIPEDAYWAAGFMGQTTMIIPSMDMVVVRLGPSARGFNGYINRAVGEIVESLRPASSSN